MNNDALIQAWKTGQSADGGDHPAGEITLYAVPTIAQRAMLLAGWSTADGIGWPDEWTISGTLC
jgi:hypothetical protein